MSTFSCITTTVTGDCLNNPGNFSVPIGTPIRGLINQCGIVDNGVKKIILGGPMMGIAQYSLDVPICKSTNGIVCLMEAEIKPYIEAICIRCGRCVEYCPVGLMPCLISMASEKERWDLTKAYGCMDCMECGSCSFECPASIPLLDYIRLGKGRVGNIIRSRN